MKQVKGTMFVMFVKAIRADKTGRFDSFLTDKDKEIVSGLVLQSSWYPYETYKNCFLAVAGVTAKNNPATLREWGRRYGEESVKTIYKSILLKKDPKAAVDWYEQVFKSQFNFGKMEMEMVSDNEIRVKVLDFDRDFEVWYHVAQGWIEKVIELVIKKPVRSEIVERSWEGAPATVFSMKW